MSFVNPPVSLVEETKTQFDQEAFELGRAADQSEDSTNGWENLPSGMSVASVAGYEDTTKKPEGPLNFDSPVFDQP